MDLVLLDLMLADSYGLDICKQIKHAVEVPIVVLTAVQDEMEQVVLLETGADGYLIKPLALRTLEAHVKSKLRRQEDKASSADGDTIVVDMTIEQEVLVFAD